MPQTLADKHVELLRQADAIVTAADALKRDMTAEEAKKVSDLTAEAKSIAAQVQAEEDAAKTRAKVREDLAAEMRAAKPKPRTVEDTVQVKAPEGTVTAREAWLDDPKRGYADHREFLGEVIRAGSTGRVSDRLASLRGKTPAMATAGSDEQSTFSDPYGGFLVPKGLIAGLMTRTSGDGDPTVGTTKVPMESPIVRVNARTDHNHATSVSGGLVLYRRAESAAATASRMQTEQVELKAESLMGLSYATEEILAASPTSFVALLSQGFGEESIAKKTNEFLRGTGVGQPLGILNAPCLVTVSAEGGQTVDTVNITNIAKMRARAWGYRNCVWIVNHDVMAQLAIMSASGAGSALAWQPSLREDTPDILLGRPLFVSEFASAIGDVGDIIIANWSQYLEGTFQPFQNAESMHVRFVEHERAFKFWTMNDGRPWWNAALTPNKGSTRSPFVTLAAR